MPPSALAHQVMFIGYQGFKAVITGHIFYQVAHTARESYLESGL